MDVGNSKNGNPHLPQEIGNKQAENNRMMTTRAETKKSSEKIGKMHKKKMEKNQPQTSTKNQPQRKEKSKSTTLAIVMRKLLIKVKFASKPTPSQLLLGSTPP